MYYVNVLLDYNIFFIMTHYDDVLFLYVIILAFLLLSRGYRTLLLCHYYHSLYLFGIIILQ